MKTLIASATLFELRQGNTPQSFMVHLPDRFRRTCFSIVTDEHGEIIPNTNSSQLKNLACHVHAWAQINLRAYMLRTSVSKRHDCIA